MWQERDAWGQGVSARGAQDAEVMLQGLKGKMWVRKWGKQMSTV